MGGEGRKVEVAAASAAAAAAAALTAHSAALPRARALRTVMEWPS